MNGTWPFESERFNNSATDSKKESPETFSYTSSRLLTFVQLFLVVAAAAALMTQVNEADSL